jgi:hypothetical protein
MRKTWINVKWTPACWYAYFDGGDMPQNVLVPIHRSAGLSFPAVKSALQSRFPDAIISGSLRLQAESHPVSNRTIK